MSTTARSATTLAPLRVMQLIAALSTSADPVPLAGLSATLDVPKSSLLSLLRTLASRGYVEAAGSGWRLGQESFALGAQIARGRPFPDNVRTLLAELHRQCEETVLVAVPSDDFSEIVYVDLIESAQSLRFSVSVGSRDPVYCTALGLAMLAFAPEAQRRRYLDTVRLKRRTDHTLVSRPQVLRFLEKVRASALSVHGGINVNVTAIAAPVFDADARVVAAVGLAGPAANFALRDTRLRQAVRCTAAAMSQRLGCSEYPPKTKIY